MKIDRSTRSLGRLRPGAARVRTGVVVVAIAAIASLVMTSPFASAQSDTGQSGSPDEDVVLRVGVTANLDNDNVWAITAGSDWIVATLQYDMLLQFGSDDLGPEPGLATGCEPNEDYTQWTCTLRDGLKWSDGTPLTSRDVAFTYRFVIDHGISQYRSYFNEDDTFETPDDTTFIWNSTEPTFAPDMPPWVYIAPEAVWSEYVGMDRKEIRAVPNTPSIASGPFTLTDHTEGQGWTMEKNPYYWGDEPAVDRIEFSLYTNQEAMIQALRNGEIDFADGIEPGLVDSVEGLENIEVHQVVSDWWLNFAFNFGGQSPQSDPLDALNDHDVREAIAMAVDKQAIVDKAYAGTAAPGDTIIRPASAYWHLDIPAEEEIPYDPEGANALLDEAGYVDTDDDGVREDPSTGEPLEMLVPASTDTTGAAEAGELIVGFLAEIGIRVDLRPVTDAKMNDYYYSGDFDAYIWYWSGDPDPDYQLWVFTSDQCGNWSDGCWADEEFDALYEQQHSTFDREERRQLVFEAQQRVYDEIPGLVLAYPGWLQAYRTDRFEGWTPAPGEHGYLLPGYNYESALTVRPVTGASTATAASAEGGIPPWVWIVAVVAVVGIAVVVSRRNRQRELEET
jgi:peptide/nickel transport system substrate-binding protein